MCNIVDNSGYIFNNLQILTDNLAVNNKISLIFLICDDGKQGLHLIKELQTSDSNLANKLFSQFLLEYFIKNVKDAADKLLEALAILQQFHVGRLLRHGRDQLEKYLLNKQVDQTRCVLYRLAENLTEKQTLDLLSKVNDNFQPECKNVELNFLQLDLDGIVSLGFQGKPIDVSSILSRADEAQAENQDETVDATSTSFRSVANNSTSSRQSTADGEYYEIIDKNDVGFCVVINQKNFTRNKKYSHLLPDQNLPPRSGSERDVEALDDVFTKLGFRVRTHSDVGIEKLRLLLPEYARSIPDHHSCFVLCVMSHGTENVVYTADSVPVQVEALEMAFQRNSCPKLVGKPKILIIQACQGRDLQGAMVDDVGGSSTLDNCTLGPERGDALIAWSTVKGYASLRDKVQGSWFIQNLCREIIASADSRDLVDIVTRVNCLLRFKSCNGMFMVPALTSSLCKKIMLPHRKL